MAIDFPAMPDDEYHYNTTGMVNVWDVRGTTARLLPTISQFLWGATFSQQINKLFSDPMQAIISLHFVPLLIPLANKQSKTLYIGNVPVKNAQDEELQAYWIMNQFVDFDCGQITVPEEYLSYMDYDATKVEIFLPFIGIRMLDTVNIMNRTIRLRYRIDVSTGACVAMLKCGNDHIYSFPGFCGVQIPLSGADYRSLYSAIIGTASSTITGATVGGGVGAVAGAVAGAVNSALGGQISVSKSGSISGSSGVLDHMTAYLIITRPRVIRPPEQASISGYPIFASGVLGTFSGFVRVRECHLENIRATADEIKEIETILKQGVILPEVTSV